jgi:hypothetical protein
VAHHDPVADADGGPYAFEISDRPLHRVRTAAGAADPARLGIPGTVIRRRELVPLEVLNTAWAAGQHHDVGPPAGHANVERGVVDLDRPGLHGRGR